MDANFLLRIIHRVKYGSCFRCSLWMFQHSSWSVVFFVNELLLSLILILVYGKRLLHSFYSRDASFCCAFNNYVRPILEYSSSILALHLVEYVERKDNSKDISPRNWVASSTNHIRNALSTYTLRALKIDVMQNWCSIIKKMQQSWRRRC